METFSFGRALELLREGKKVARQGWNGANQFLQLQSEGHEGNPMNLPFIFITVVGGNRVPWVASQSDILTDDWFEVAGV